MSHVRLDTSNEQFLSSLFSGAKGLMQSGGLDLVSESGAGSCL
jgi:hypothetical protein